MFSSIKDFLRRQYPVREAVRQYRLWNGHPDWRPLLGASAGWDRVSDRPSAGPTVLIATTTGGYLAASHVESLLAIALKLRGARVHVLLCDGVLPACLECNSDWYPNPSQFARGGPGVLHCHGCFHPSRSVFASIGAQVHTLSEVLGADERREASERARSVPRSEIASYTLDGLAVGEHAMAGALRFYARATLADGEVEERILRRYLEAAILSVKATRRVLAATASTVAVFHHGIYVPHGLIGEVARTAGVRVVNWHVAYRKQTFIFSHHDTYHHTLMNEPVGAWDQMRWTPEIEEHLLSYLSSRWEGANDWIKFHREPQFDLAPLAREFGVDFSRPVIGLLTSVMWDAQLHYPANAFRNQLEWVIRTIEYFRGRPDLQLLIRVHPAEITGTLRSRQPLVAEIARAFPTLPQNVAVIPPEHSLSTYAAMLKCNAVLIYGTKTGVELASFGVPVIVAGEAWIRNKGITFDATSQHDYLAMLDRLPLAGRMPTQTLTRARKYAFHFFFRRMIPIDFVEQTPGIPGFGFAVSDPSQLAPGASRGLDVICDGILQGTPFVFPAEELITPRHQTISA